MAETNSGFMLISVGKTAATVYTLDYLKKVIYKILVENIIKNKHLKQ